MSNLRLTKIIERKRDGKALCEEELLYFIKGVTRTARHPNEPNHPEYAQPSQIGAMLMAMYLKGLDEDETEYLTEMMKNSGNTFDWPEKLKPLIVDKHSTGGVGDKVSLILAPALAALGLKVPMISGRILGHTGGTLNKLESIPGFRVSLDQQEILAAITEVGCCIVSQTEDCVPADKILYNYREITGTVSSLPLIISSIVSKKLSENPSALVYDVKYGKGAFSSYSDAEHLARKLVRNSKGVKCSAYLTSMDNPLGKTIGNSLEVCEAVECLKGKGHEDLLEVVSTLGSELLRLTRNTTEEEGIHLIRGVLCDDTALNKFFNMCLKQGVSERVAKELCFGRKECVMPKAQHEMDIAYFGENGFVSGIEPMILAKAWKEEFCRSNNHPGVGFTLVKSVGDKIKSGDVWLKMHHGESELSFQEIEDLKAALTVTKHYRKKEIIDKRYTNCCPK